MTFSTGIVTSPTQRREFHSFQLERPLLEQPSRCGAQEGVTGIRPIEASKTVVCYVHLTSIRAIRSLATNVRSGQAEEHAREYFPVGRDSA
jgi:hypothetical protein